MKVVVAVTGASGALYAKQLLLELKAQKIEACVIPSQTSKLVWMEELGEKVSDLGFETMNPANLAAPCASGSAQYDQMVVIPCSMGTLARIAHGVSTDLISRTADVFLKERRRLILVPRETPYNLIHVENMRTLLLAGATILPATPSFYSKPKSIEELANTVVSRVLDQMEISNTLMERYNGLCRQA